MFDEWVSFLSAQEENISQCTTMKELLRSINFGHRFTFLWAELLAHRKVTLWSPSTTGEMERLSHQSLYHQWKPWRLSLGQPSVPTVTNKQYAGLFLSVTIDMPCVCIHFSLQGRPRSTSDGTNKTNCQAWSMTCLAARGHSRLIRHRR